MHKKKVLLASAFNSTFTYPLANGFNKLGFQVYLYDYRNLLGNLVFNFFLYTLLIPIAFLKRLFVRHQEAHIATLNDLLYFSCLLYRPEYLFVVKGENIFPETLQRIKKLGITTMLWQVDPTFDPRIWSFVEKVGHDYDIYISCEPGSVITKLKKKGFKNILYMLGAADDKDFLLPDEGPFKYDITFIGTYHPKREQFLEALNGLDVHIWGWGDWYDSKVAHMFEGKALSQKNMLSVYRQSKIVVNIGRAIGSTIPTNLRPFEAAQVGAFILVDFTPNLKDVFTVEKEIDTFKSPRELRQKVDFYLRHPKERLKIAHAMQKRVMRNHTYEARLKELFGQIEKLSI